MLTLISKSLMPHNTKAEAQVFLCKLQGDYFRYVAEVGEGDRFEKASSRALKSYNDGLTKSEDLSGADSTRLSLMLNFAVFCYDTLQQKEEGIRIARQAIEEAEEDLDKISPSD